MTAFGRVDGLRLPAPFWVAGYRRAAPQSGPFPHPEERILGPASSRRGFDWLATRHSRRLPEIRLELVEETVQPAARQTPDSAASGCPARRPLPPSAR